MKLTIIGGGGFRVPLVYRALRSTDVARVTLQDTDPRRAAVIDAVLRGMGDGPPVRVAEDLDDALADADVVFLAVRAGGTAGRARDERAALAEGVLGQETVGAGGVLYGLRTVPVALELARRIRRAAPRAWVVNFTNPAGMVTEAMSGTLGHRVIGICDSPVGLVRRAARAAGVRPATDPALTDAGDLLGGELGCDYVGINHLGWLRSLTLHGRDLLPGLLADDAALASFEEGRLFGPDWLRALGALPNEYLYFYYFRRESLAAARAADETRGAFLHRRQSAFFARAADAEPEVAYALWERTRREREETYLAEARAAGGGWRRDAQDVSDGGYEQVAVALLRALQDGGGTRPPRLILNVRNGGAVPALPGDAVVETVCEVAGEGAHPVPCVTPGTAELGLMAQVKAAERATVAAAVSGAERDAVRALALHPLVDSPAVAARILARHRADVAGAAGDAV